MEESEIGISGMEQYEDRAFDYHREMRKPENIFKPYKGEYKYNLDDIKNCFLLFRNERIKLINPVVGDYSYSDYLGSYYWRILSLYYRNFVSDICQKCGSRESLHVHHQTYKLPNGDPIFGQEYLFIKTAENPLITLCASCHAKQHGKKTEVSNG